MTITYDCDLDGRGVTLGCRDCRSEVAARFTTYGIQLVALTCQTCGEMLVQPHDVFTGATR